MFFPKNLNKYAIGIFRYSRERMQPMFAFNGAREGNAANSQKGPSKRRHQKDRRHFRQRQLCFEAL